MNNLNINLYIIAIDNKNIENIIVISVNKDNKNVIVFEIYIIKYIYIYLWRSSIYNKTTFFKVIYSDRDSCLIKCDYIIDETLFVIINLPFHYRKNYIIKKKKLNTTMFIFYWI